MASLSLSFGAWLPVVRTLPASCVNQVAITIDDAPTPEATPGLLAHLKRHNMTATFFVSGFRAEQAPELVKAIIEEGHAVYAHGWEHVRLDREPRGRLIRDMERSERMLAALRPTPQPYLVRLPYNGGYRNAAVHRALAAWKPGCQIAHWLLSTEDHVIAESCRDEADVVRAAKDAVACVLNSPRLAGSVILMHDQPVNALPEGGLKAQASLEVMKALVDGLAAKSLASVALRPVAQLAFLSRFAFS